MQYSSVFFAIEMIKIKIRCLYNIQHPTTTISPDYVRSYSLQVESIHRCSCYVCMVHLTLSSSVPRVICKPACFQPTVLYLGLWGFKKSSCTRLPSTHMVVVHTPSICRQAADVV